MKSSELEKHTKDFILSQFEIMEGENIERMVQLFLDGYSFHMKQISDLSLGGVSNCPFCVSEGLIINKSYIWDWSKDV